MHVLVVPSSHFITPADPLAGVFQFEQARALARAGLRVGVLSLGFITLRRLLAPYPYPDRETLDGVEVFRRYRRSLRVERLVRPDVARRRLVRILDEEYPRYEREMGRPDVVHAHGLSGAGFIAERLHADCNVPFAVTEHSSAFARGMVPATYDVELLRVARSAGALTSVSRGSSDFLSARFGMDFGVLPNIVDPLFISEPFLAREDSQFTFMTAGNLESNKDHESLLVAFSSVFAGRPVRLKIAGIGPLRAMLEATARRLGVSRQVEFLGQVSRAQMSAEMRSAHCFVLPSRYETFGVVLIEALASGLPVVATKSGGPLDIVNETNGLLVEPGDVTRLAEAMERIVSNPRRYDSSQLRAEAAARFGEQAFVRNALHLYGMALASDSAGKAHPRS